MFTNLRKHNRFQGIRKKQTNQGGFTEIKLSNMAKEYKFTKYTNFILPHKATYSSGKEKINK